MLLTNYGAQHGPTKKTGKFLANAPTKIGMVIILNFGLLLKAFQMQIPALS
jgi:hypothetical protein